MAEAEILFWYMQLTIKDVLVYKCVHMYKSIW